MKDLVDLVLIATGSSVRAEELSVAIRMEVGRRNMEPITSFHAPKSWIKPFAVFARKSGVDVAYCDFYAAEKLACAFLDPVLSGSVLSGSWSVEAKKWIGDSRPAIGAKLVTFV
ncbi:MAG: hypothetical protein RR655_06290, partial [Raoultibacter sp.]